MTEILDEKKLSHLPTKKFYNQLNNVKDFCQNNTFYITASDLLDRYDGLHKVYDKILKGLCYAYGKNFTDLSDKDICNFVYYWLGDILYDNLNPWFLFDSVISTLFVIFKIRNGKMCKAPPYYIFDEREHFKNIKLFFNYSKDYDTYKEQITNDNLTCNEKYYEYLQKYVDTYKDYEGKCKNGQSSSGYCKAFNEYFANKDPTNLSKLTCKLEDNETEAREVHDERKATEEETSLTNGVDGVKVTLSGRTEEGKEQGAKAPSSSVHPSSQGTSDLINISGPADVPSISTTKTIATTASVAGILVPPFLVYNFTPVRSWINKLLGRKPIYRNPLTERELIENSYQHHHFDSERNRYNISYRPE